MRLCRAVLQDGFPVLLEFTGRTDIAPVFDALGEEDFLRYVCWYHECQEEFMRSCRAADGTSRHKMNCIVDMAGLAMRHATPAVYAAIQKRVRLEEDNYPEVVRTVSLVNAPAFFTGIWAIVSVFLDEGTRNKISIHGSKFSAALEAKGIDVASLPDVLGGSTTDHGIHLGGVLPPHFAAGFGSEGETIELAAGRVCELAVVLAEGEALSWEFSVSDSRDVEFSAYLLPPSEALRAGLPAECDVSPPVGDSQTGYAVVRVKASMYDDGSTESAVLGHEVPFSGASEVHGFQSLRAKSFKHTPTEAWHCIQSAGRVKQAKSHYPVEASLPSVRYNSSSTWAVPRLGAYWSASPPRPNVTTSLQPQASEAEPEAPSSSAEPPSAEQATPPAAAGAGAAAPTVAEDSPKTSHFVRPEGKGAHVVVLRWSNAYSWMKSKVIARRLTVWSKDGMAESLSMQPQWISARAASKAKTVPHR